MIITITTLRKIRTKNLKVVSFGYNNNADVYPVRITKFKKNKRITLKIKDQFLNVEVRNLNIYNILASFALLKELKLDLQKAIKILKKCNLRKEEVRYTISKDIKRNLN